MTIRTLFFGSAIAAAVLIGGWFVFGPKPVLVEKAVVTKGPFVAMIVEDGQARIREKFRMSSPLAGRVSRISLRAGDVIKAGDTLFVVEPSLPPLIDPRVRQELEARVGAAEANVAEAKVAQDRLRIVRDKSKLAYDRTNQLKQRGVASVSSLDDALFAYNAAERDIAAANMRFHAAEHNLEAARSALRISANGKWGVNERLSVTSPINGQVLRILQESESTVESGKPILEIGDIGDLEVAVDLLTSDAVRVKERAVVSIAEWGGARVLQGRVRRVEPSGFMKVSALGVEEQRVWVLIDIVSPREVWGRLADGFRVEARIVVEEIPDAITIPVGALFRRNDTWFVFVISGGLAVLRQVELRQSSGRTAVVAKGLVEGEIVIHYPPSSLNEGSKVRFLQ